MIAKPAATAETCGTNTPSTAAPIVESSSGQSRLSSVMPGRSSGSAICIRASARTRAIGGEAALRRPSHAPISAAAIHQPIATSQQRRLDLVAHAHDRQRGEEGRGARAEHHRRLEEVDEPHGAVRPAAL